MANYNELKKRLQNLESICDAVKKEATQIRVHLESFNSPAPKGAKKKNPLSKIEELKLKQKLRKHLKVAI